MTTYCEERKSACYGRLLRVRPALSSCRCACAVECTLDSGGLSLPMVKRTPNTASCDVETAGFKSLNISTYGSASSAHLYPITVVPVPVKPLVFFICVELGLLRAYITCVMHQVSGRSGVPHVRANPGPRGALKDFSKAQASEAHPRRSTRTRCWYRSPHCLASLRDDFVKRVKNAQGWRPRPLSSRPDTRA